MTPDKGYQRSVRRLRVCCWAVALGTFVLALWVGERFPYAAGVLVILTFGALRIADEVREEIEGWT